ncbi:hypothetical protein MKX03_014811 [Papaver bracteatum]|nr:hypothetical protein MKX03_014811 [Papaver bracteatum]
MDYFVSIDGYFRAGRKGGYGFIIRDNVGKPIVASAVASTEAVSFLYHLVEGITRAVELAVEFSLRDIQLFCNAKHVVRLVNRVVQTVSGCRLHCNLKNHFDVICKICVKRRVKEEYDSVFPLLKRIGELQDEFHTQLQAVKVSKERNKAADYLAKNAAPGTEVLHPCNFPDELKEILCTDYVGSKIYGLPCFC